ncbi:MAG: trypsin-like serine protease [Nitrosopumilaceae archaeon]
MNLATVGFKATYNGKTGFVTAGHAFINSAGNQMGGTVIKQSSFSTSDIGNKIAMNIAKGVPTWCDCAVVEENSLFRSMDDGVYSLADPNATESPYWNQLVTISGGVTGLSSGYVNNLNWDYSLDLDKNGTLETPVNDAIKAGYSSQAGDSGSPIISYSGNLVGIHVGSGGVFMSHSAVTNAFPGLTWGF